MRDAVAFDMDGLLCDTTEVEQLAAEDFAAFQEAAVRCPPAEPYVAAARAASEAGAGVVIITSREFIWRDQTLDWLIAADVPHQALYMRVVGDYRKDTVVKAELVAQAREDGFEVTDAWDDSAEVRAMYESLGIRAHA